MEMGYLRCSLNTGIGILNQGNWGYHSRRKELMTNLRLSLIKRFILFTIHTLGPEPYYTIDRTSSVN